MTPREVQIIHAGAAKGQRDGLERAAWQAWKTAHLVRVDRKHWPSRFEDVLPRERQAARRQSWQTQKSIAQMWSAAFGGKVD